MTITEINFRMVSSNESPLIAFASCVIDDQLLLNNIAIKIKPGGDIYLNFPRYQTHSGSEFPYYKPINHEMYAAIKSALVTAMNLAGRPS